MITKEQLMGLLDALREMEEDYGVVCCLVVANRDFFSVTDKMVGCQVVYGATARGPWGHVFRSLSEAYEKKESDN